LKGSSGEGKKQAETRLIMSVKPTHETPQTSYSARVSPLSGIIPLSLENDGLLFFTRASYLKGKRPLLIILLEGVQPMQTLGALPTSVDTDRFS
jgi:hypothetical protein